MIPLCFVLSSVIIIQAFYHCTSFHVAGNLEHAFCTETRPYNQGARLTAYELVYENIPSTLIVDSAVSLLMTKHKLAAVVVGADRVVANGDTANKIGTYQLAITGKSSRIFPQKGTITISKGT